MIFRHQDRQAVCSAARVARTTHDIKIAISTMKSPGTKTDKQYLGISNLCVSALGIGGCTKVSADGTCRQCPAGKRDPSACTGISLTLST